MRLGLAVNFSRCLVLYYSDTFDLVLVIIHFNDENFDVWWHFSVRHFSRRPIDTFQRALVDLFVGLLVRLFPVLVFLPCFGVEPRTGNDMMWGGHLIIIVVVVMSYGGAVFY